MNIQHNQQHTLKHEFSMDGVGLHSGLVTKIKVLPASPGHGIKFQRIDLPNEPIIKADVDYVVDTSRGTTLEHNEVRVATIEHLLAALTGMGVDNALIQMDNEEVPILDGSSKGYVDAIEKVGIEEQNAKKIYFSIDTNISYVDEDKNVEMVATPSTEYKITTLIDFNSKVLGTQHASLKGLNQFKKEISPARTFCFLHELEYLYNNNLIKGGTLDNAIVVVDRIVENDELDKLAKIFKRTSIKVESEGILNNIKLHFSNEPARHKLLDIIGDLTLIGYPIKANIIASRPGHKSNVAFAKKIKDYIKKNKNMLDVPVYDPTNPAIFDINYISQLLPHRYPFLLVDKVIELSDNHVVGIKNITFNEPCFTGHFPNNPVFPAVLQLEALAQTGGVLVLNNQGGPEKKFDTYFLKIDNARFKQKVLPGDTLILKMELTQPIRRGICEMKGTAYVGNKIVCEADLMAQIVPRT
ncbi:MAG: bifunctional UDP-3-O-[3-hydroxymyristoyl] N-acetylglucosamine deacetylase/3-hydroxyacyl-ACP dehydratase [Chitinophagaceae bacterium]|nr:MAG: bifunctional UDP-3-O-(3-hydroxymyristoyl) N-acetylglucosamine deacetylase/(3R)-hydroxymyristoyl-ACP dehydratase [Bacteroidetes bacterium OLB11]MCC6448101.1 bifunctional UDP-3-O-[3-hydroxymyristoyl] N-acetylglucosamine deacetylase/3-hydroxyacyl-ACP dehydratase [Chitinophagaceae bacterium]HMN32660.1 bifunctional UDP-3-O-[3-hydroxymyristoyl] N-acetylglucosamine deacetylase/3-hydroxyacyl-ACP dehydratase [Chitinophagaceae bacterium]